MTYVKRLKVGTLTQVTTTNQLSGLADHGGALSDIFQNDTGLWTFGYLLIVDPGMGGAGTENGQIKVAIYPAVDGTNALAHGGLMDIDREVEACVFHSGDSAVTRVVALVGWLPSCEFQFYFVNEMGGAMAADAEAYFLPCTYEVIAE